MKFTGVIFNKDEQSFTYHFISEIDGKFESRQTVVKFKKDPITYSLTATFSQEFLEDLSSMINKGI